MNKGDKVRFTHDYTCGLTGRRGTMQVLKGEVGTVHKSGRDQHAWVEVRVIEKLKPDDCGAKVLHVLKVKKEILECQTASPTALREDDTSQSGSETPVGPDVGYAEPLKKEASGLKRPYEG